MLLNKLLDYFQEHDDLFQLFWDRIYAGKWDDEDVEGCVPFILYSRGPWRRSSWHYHKWEFTEFNFDLDIYIPCNEDKDMTNQWETIQLQVLDYLENMKHIRLEQPGWIRWMLALSDMEYVTYELNFVYTHVHCWCPHRVCTHY